jgi:hypothetical protein
LEEILYSLVFPDQLLPMEPFTRLKSSKIPVVGKLLEGVGVGVFVGVDVGVKAGVLVGVLVGVEVGVKVGVLVGVFVAVFVGVGVGVLGGSEVGTYSKVPMSIRIVSSLLPSR